MGKLPAFLFYPADYYQDTRCLTLEAKGAWMDILCAMWRTPERGKITLSMDEFSRVIGADLATTKCIIDTLCTRNICDFGVHENGDVTLVNRRMSREEKERNGNKERQAKLREKGGGDPNRWTAIRVPILERDRYMCAYCGRRGDTVDHVIPKSKGGNEERNNLVACCKRCNMKKNNRTPEEANMSFWKGFTWDNANNNTRITPPSSSSVAFAVTKENKEYPLTPSQKHVCVRSLPDWFPEELWDTFLDHRKAVKAPITPKSYPSFLKKFEKLRADGWSPSVVVDVMVEKGWRWFKPEWMKDGDGQKPPLIFTPSDEYLKQKAEELAKKMKGEK